MESCIFCKIARKEIPAKIVAESSLALAFEDLNPQAPLHVLVIPKEHLDSFMDLTELHSETALAMLALAQKIVRLKNASETGARLAINYGPDAGQSVKHLHLHVLGKRTMAWPPWSAGSAE